MTIERIKPKMTKSAIKNAAYKTGYVFKGYWKCEACTDEATSKGVLDRPYTNVVCALKFHKKGSTRVACTCGWRKDMTIKFTKVEKPKCPAGCGATLKQVGDECFNPKCPSATPNAPDTTPPPAKVCSRPGCNNPGPAGRKTLCDTCRAASKEPVSSTVYQ